MKPVCTNDAVCNSDMHVYTPFILCDSCFTQTRRRGVVCNIYAFFIYIVRIYVISRPGNQYFTALPGKLCTRAFLVIISNLYFLLEQQCCLGSKRQSQLFPKQFCHQQACPTQGCCISSAILEIDANKPSHAITPHAEKRIDVH